MSRYKPLTLSLILIGALGRLAPHPPNFTPVNAMSVFAGARLCGWQAYLVPLLIMVITDPILAAIGGFRAFDRMRLFVYGSLMISVWIGRRLRATESAARIGLAAVLCSAQFYLITNFAVWLGSRFYPQNLAGLGACYLAALPFLGRMMAGDLIYSGALFGLHAWLSRAVYPAEKISTEPAA